MIFGKATGVDAFQSRREGSAYRSRHDLWAAHSMQRRVRTGALLAPLGSRTYTG